MEAVILGSGGWVPTAKRETCSALVRHGADVLLIDAGTGLKRLLERTDLVEHAENVHLVLTHFHLDHVVGLSYLPALPLPVAPVIWGPADVLYGKRTRSILHRLLGPPLFSATIDEIAATCASLQLARSRSGPSQ